MAQTGFSPILIYASGTATNIPSAGNLTSSANGAELALNYADGKLYFKNSSGVVTLLASSSTVAPVTTFSAGTTGFTPSSATSGAVTLAGTLATTNGGTGLTAFTSGGAVYATSTSALTTGTLPVASGGTGVATITGIIKGSGTSAFSAATAGTDYAKPDTASTWTALQTFAGTSSNADLKTSNILEVATISATAATGTINYDVTTQSVLYYTSNASANWTVNFRGSSGTSLDTLMSTGESISTSFIVTQGATAYYNSAVQIDGTTSGVTTKWQGSAPTSGNASAIDSYTYVLVKTGSATFTVFATQTKFA